MKNPLRNILMLSRRYLSGGIVELDGVKIDTRPIASRSIKNLIFKGTYEEDERVLLARLCRPGDTVLEIGAGIGVVGLVAARLCAGGGVVSYEANPEMEAAIRASYALNLLTPELICEAVTVDGLPTAFHLTENIISSSAFSRPGADAPTVTVSSVSFQEALRQSRANLVVVDVEGLEDALLRGADLSSVGKLLVEFHPHIIGEGAVCGLRDHLNSIGFVELSSSGHNVAYTRAV